MTLTVPTGISADPEAQQEYVDALNKQLAALENRGGTNWFKMAAAFADPGRTGSFGESFGKAMGVLGQQQEEEQKQALPIAQMRAQLAGQKYQLAQDARSQEMIIGALGGMSLQDAAQAISTPQGAVANPALMQRLSMVQALIPPGSKYADQVKNMIDTQSKMLDYGIKSGQLTLDQIRTFNQGLETQYKTGASPIMPNVSGAPQAGGTPPSGEKGSFDFSSMVKNGVLTSPQGQRNGTEHNGIDIGAPKGASINSPVGGTVVFAGNGGNKAGNMVTIEASDGSRHSFMHMDNVDVKVGDTIDPFSTIGQVGATGNATGNHVHYQAIDAKGNPINVADQFRSKKQSVALSPEKAQQVEQTRQEQEIKSQAEAASKRGEPFTAKHNALADYDYNTVAMNDMKTRELMQLVKDNPKVVGQLVHQGPIYALMQAAESGVTTPWGTLSVPVTESLNKLTLDEDQQAIARNITQLISDLNQSVMKTGKAIYGPQISVFDAQQMAKPGFKETDPASFLMYLAGKNIVTNKFMGEMADAQAKYFEDNPTAKTASFFRSKEYKDIADRFHATYNDLIKKSPYAKK